MSEPARSTTPDAKPALPSRSRWWTLVAASVATFMLLLDFTVVNLALPAIHHDIGGSFTDLQLIVDAYAVSMAALILVAGSMADHIGYRRAFLIGVAIFSLASLVCGIAHRPAVLNYARAVQGLGAAATLASSLALLGVTFEGRERQFALAVWGAVSGTAVAVGPVVGGVVVEYLSWHWIFFINVPIGAGLVLLALTAMRDAREPEHGPFDWMGALTLTLALGALVFALLRGNADGWSSITILAPLFAAAVLLAILPPIERRARKPILDLKLLGTPTMVGASVAAFTIGLTVFASLLFLSLYLQDILRYSPLAAGLRLLPVTLGAFVASFGTVWLSRHFSPRLTIGVGLALCAGAFLAMHGLTVRSTWTALLAGSALGGAATGLVNPTVAGMALRAGEGARTGMASGINSACRLLGLATGVAALGAIFEHRIQAELQTSAPELPRQAAGAISAGIITPVVEAFPPLLRGAIRDAATSAFISGLNELFLVGFAIAVVAGIVTVLVVRTEAPLSGVADSQAPAVAAEAPAATLAAVASRAER